ncbi:MAG: hypothetical protein ACO3NL_00050 [Phycisphaerales bacterium]
MSEQEIELVLPEEEYDPRAADVIQERQPDQDFSEEKSEEQAQHSEELDDYSDSVKKRIDKLTYRMREAERQRDEALTYAESLYKEKTSLQTRLSSADANLVSEYQARVKSDAERARRALREAQELGDAEAIALATEALTKVTLEEQNVKRAQNRQKIESRRRLASNRQQNQVQSRQQAAPPPPDPRAQDWHKSNQWFGQDRVMTEAAIAIDDTLKKEGVNPASDEYYQRLDAELREYFPNRFSQTKNVQSSVVGSSRGAGQPQKGARKVSLTPSQVAIAKRIGVPLEEYAKYV